MDVLDSQDYLARILDMPRAGMSNILAFYEHRVGGICTDARLLLVPLDDHLCHRGDGVFESIVYRQGRMLQLDAHMERMKHSVQGLKLVPPCSWKEIRATILAVAAAGQKDAGAIRVLIGRGPGGFGISPTECPTSSLYIVAHTTRMPDEKYYAKGLTAFRSAIPAKQEYLAKIKNANYLPNVLMAEEALEKGLDVGFSFTDDGFLAEAAVANVALVNQEGQFLCPPFTHSLPGTTLLAALDVAKKSMPTAFAHITENDIRTAREILLFASTPLCVAITQYEGCPVGTGVPGAVAHMLRETLAKQLPAEGVPF